MQSLVEAGVLEGSARRIPPVGDLGRLRVPPTIQALLAARIDRLPERARRLLQTAAVIGKRFPEPLLHRVSGVPEEDLAEGLRTLRQRDLIYEQALFPKVIYAFKHPLTQEVAYGSQLAESRRMAHAAVAERARSEGRDAAGGVCRAPRAPLGSRRRAASRGALACARGGEGGDLVAARPRPHTGARSAGSVTPSAIHAQGHRCASRPASVCPRRRLRCRRRRRRSAARSRKAGSWRSTPAIATPGYGCCSPTRRSCCRASTTNSPRGCSPRRRPWPPRSTIRRSASWFAVTQASRAWCAARA